MTKVAAAGRLHDIGMARPKVPHAEWVEWMNRCAAAWDAAGEPAQAASVRAMLARNEPQASCSVCTWTPEGGTVAKRDGGRLHEEVEVDIFGRLFVCDVREARDSGAFDVVQGEAVPRLTLDVEAIAEALDPEEKDAPPVPVEALAGTAAPLGGRRGYLTSAERTAVEAAARERVMDKLQGEDEARHERQWER